MKYLTQASRQCSCRRVRNRCYSSTTNVPSSRRPLRRSSSTSTSAQEAQHPSLLPDYWTNDGVVEGVWIFSRHGDRTPSRPLTPLHRRDEEAAYWMTKLPIPDSATVFENFSKYFPVEQQQKGASFIDLTRNPFGFLTSKGLQQLSENGHRFFNRYNNHAHHLPERKLWTWGNAQDFLNVWNVQVYSTNYLRTILSVQSFLDGLFGTHCYQPEEGQQRVYDSAVIKEEKIPNDVGADYTDDTTGNSCRPLVKIKVRDLKNDPLNAFDRNPDLIADLVSEVMVDTTFRQRDGKAASLAARLANILPGLVRQGSSDFSARSPSGINWVEAADHFVCRSAHGVDAIRWTDFENDDRMAQTLQAMAHPTLAHLSWRFRKWYQNERLLAVIAAPLLREIAQQIAKTPYLSDHERRPFVIYSCHDITILGLLYGIGADFLAKGAHNLPRSLSSFNETSGNDAGSWRYWPPYGCTLVFELVRIQEGPPGPDTHVVRILLNGIPVRSVNANMTNKNLKSASIGMLSIDDFNCIVSNLEKAGGHDYAHLLGHT